MTMGLTLRRTARRINRLKGASALVPPGYLPPGHQTPDLLLHSPNEARLGSVVLVPINCYMESIRMLPEPRQLGTALDSITKTGVRGSQREASQRIPANIRK